MTYSTAEIQAAKERLKIPELWHLLGLPGQPARSCKSPFRDDRKPSFSVYEEGKRFKDFAGPMGDAIDFLAQARGVPNGAALQEFMRLAGGTTIQPRSAVRTRREPVVDKKPNLTCLGSGTKMELIRVAKSRRLGFDAVRLAYDMGTLRFATVKGFRSWVLTDEGGWCAEARRLDARPYPVCRSEWRELSERKAHTLFGSKKAWPVGILPAVQYRRGVETILLVEGGPDYLSVLHFALQQRKLGILPVAMLGRSTGLRGLHSGALELFQGHRVRICPHNDPDGLGVAHALRWSRQLEQAECVVDFFVFSGLRKVDGAQVKDLNDCTELAPQSVSKLEELFP
jgi:hypothetical protein